MPDAPKKHDELPSPPDLVRLSKRMAELGLCSRREADDYIARGLVEVDGQVVAELGSKVRRDQSIALRTQAARQQAALATVLLHKPVGYVSGQAEHGYPHAIELVVEANRDRSFGGGELRPEQRKGLVAAGRLDIDSTGLLVLTQDGRVARQLIGEDRQVDKEYLVRVQGAVTPEAIAALRHGLWLDGQALLPAQVDRPNPDQLRFVLREGKKRQIRRMCTLVGLEVIGLKRIRIGQVRLGRLAVGQWRFLRPGEHF
ncbi:MAG: rRNA pseudouridine synthase [Deltaproteobacteria bacterium]|nr:rRNA pseudouridine synthase [Deltaproteobacteria bacterium]